MIDRINGRNHYLRLSLNVSSESVVYLRLAPRFLVLVRDAAKVSGDAE